MLETTIRIPEQLKELNDSLETLSEKPSFEQAQKVVNKVIALLGVNETDTWRPFNDSQGKIRSNAAWFMLARGFADKRAVYKIADNNPQSIDLKCYWMNKLNKSVISWLAALTPNFEDEPFYGNLNVSIDFVIPKKADRILVILSKNYVIRAVELQDFLSATQQEIFNAWLTGFDYSNKAQVHDILWKSFDLEPVNKSFYKGISAFFVELKQFLSENAKIFNEKQAAYFTNRLIGRIVFCWFLDKKGIIDLDAEYFKTGASTASEYYHQKLETLFFKVLNTPPEDRDTSDSDSQKKMFPELAEKNIFNIDVDFKTPFLNGGLFEVKDNDKFENSELIFPDDYFDRLLEFLRHYNFTTDESTSAFQQVAIDPEMLGRIFENLLAEQVEETGEQARKAKGAFYTPREIVDYMCRESLREYLKTKIPEDDLRDHRIDLLLDVKPHEFRDQQRNYRSDLKLYKYDILKALDEIKIIDPACGSGAFPMGMLHLLLDIYDRLDATFDSYKKKIEIIKNNLFGVDLEPMAVEICRLRAWLSIVVDEETDSKKIQPLPNLDFKFICANSLIPLDRDGQQTFGDDPKLEEKITKIRDDYYSARKLSRKNKLRKDYDVLMEQKRQRSLFGKSKKQEQLETYHPFDLENVSQFFDAKFMFGIEDGFDVVIGNPPYVGEKGHKNIFKPLKKTSLGERFYQGRMDLFYFFIHLGVDLLVEKGLLSFITTNYYVTAAGGGNLRKDLKRRTSILKLINFNELRIFESAAGQHNLITILSKKYKDTVKLKACVTNRKGSAKSEILESILKWNDCQTEYYSVLLPNLYDGEECYIRLSGLSSEDQNDSMQKLLDKLKRMGKPLHSICKVNNGLRSGIDKVKINGENKGVFVLTANEARKMRLSSPDIIKKYFKNSDILKYTTKKETNKYVIYASKNTDIFNYDDVKRHLEIFKETILKKRWKESVPWYSLVRPRSKEIFILPKIVSPQRSKSNTFGYSENEWYAGSDVFFITLKNGVVDINLKYVLAVLNSSLYYYWLYFRGKRKGDNLELIGTPVKEIPVRIVPANKQKPFIDIIDQILLKKVDDINADTSSFEKQVDNLVFDLYELTPEERKIVENPK